MSSQNLPHKKIIVGAGVSGATAARELIKSGVNPEDIIVLEINDYVGGKLKTYTSPVDPDLKTEYGAGVLVHNYPAIDVMHEKQMKLEKLIKADHSGLDFYKEIMKRPLLGKLTYALDFAWQQIKFAKHVWSYNQACTQLREKLPPDYELTFSEFADKKKLNKIACFIQFLVPGFGYGSLNDKNNYAYRILNYMGYTTIPSICMQSLAAVHGGYQQLVENMLEGIDVKTKAQITKIDRKNGSVKVQYQHNGNKEEILGDTLILANSPYYWHDLNMNLSPAEQQCVDNFKYYRYPVAICRIEGLPPKQIFIPEAMKKEGFGHPAFLFTRDNRKETTEACDLVSVTDLPQKNHLENLNIQSKTAYVRYRNQLYWINQKNNICVEIPLSPEKLGEFDKTLKPANACRRLSKDEMQKITAITQHSTEGRLYTVYINLPEGQNNFSLEPGSKDRETIINDLKKLPGVKAVHIDDTIIWKDYNPSVPWNIGINLQKEERSHTNNTLHVGTYLPGSFETVAGAGQYAEKAVQHWQNIHQSKLQEAKINIKRALQFFALPKEKPYQGDRIDSQKKNPSQKESHAKETHFETRPLTPN